MNQITIDPNGIVWLATDTGVSKFDGTSFTKYTNRNSGLVNNTVDAIAVDSLGNKWIGTDYGLNKFDGDTTWEAVSTFSGMAINCISVDPNNNIWVGTDNALYKLSDTNLIRTYTTANSRICDNTINDIVFDKLGNTWIATDAGGISKLTGDTTFTNYDTSNSGLKWNTVNAIAIDAKGNKWIGTDARGAYYFNDTTWVNYSYFNVPAGAKTSGKWMSDSTVNAIAIDTSGNIWFGTDSKGLKVLDSTFTKWTSYTKSNNSDSLKSNKIGGLSLVVDKNNNIYIGPGALGFTILHYIYVWPTPITLSSFSGIIEVKKNTLNWATATEENSKGFEVERSINGVDFVNIGFVSSVKISGGARYDFTDNAPSNGKNYYRLKLIDNDGAYYYSETVLLDNAAKDELTIYPNPASNFINIATSTSKGNVYILDVTSRILKTVTLTSNLNSVDVSKLPTGVYFCKGANKTVSFVKK